MRETVAEARLRWAKLLILQSEYTEFETFLEDVMLELGGWETSEQQKDIARFMQYGPDLAMIMAQRGQAKTTIAGAFAVWKLIHNPRFRILILSGGDDLASEISTWVISIIRRMPILEFMRPDTGEGDRSGVDKFDIHYTLRGADKSPSVSCKGINGQIQGKRADLLIPDDIEQKANSSTEVQREKIREISRDFSSICSTGKILYLGTPQSVDSTYNSLPERGYTVRVWPGRFPTEEEEENYHGLLAPSIIERMKNDPSLRTGGGPTGSRGKATDELIIPESKLTEKEIDQGPAHFQLQFMLDTRLMDADRYPLSITKMGFTTVMPKMPIHVHFAPGAGERVSVSQEHPMKATPMYRITGGSLEFGSLLKPVMYVDPSGGGRQGDELTFAVTSFLAGYVYWTGIGGRPGGIHKDNLDWLIAALVKYKPGTLLIERNYGNGALAQVLRPMIQAANISVNVEEPWETGQKELRIIDTLEPLLGAGRLIVDEDVIRQDLADIQRYPPAVKKTYSALYQIDKMTRERGALQHDDRADALAGACRPWTELLAQDASKAAKAAATAALNELRKNPRGKPSYAMNKPGRAGLWRVNLRNE